jgi:hypothetical protein
LSQFLLHTFAGRILLVALFLVISLLLASILGWLPALH